MWLVWLVVIALLAVLAGAFWWSGDKRWEAVAAVSTLAAVLAALFGEWFKGRVWRPVIDFHLKSKFGELTTINFPATDGSTKSAAVRYYHLTVHNRKRWPVATQVQVVLLRIEEPRPADGRLVVTWTGDVPMQWRHQNIYPLARQLGPSADCDLLYVSEGKWISVLPIIVPNNFPLAARALPISGVVLTLQVRAAEADSPIKQFRISWDGQWERGEAEMANHVVIEEIT